MFKLSFEFATKKKKNLENLSYFKINEEIHNGDSNYLHLFRCRYVKCLHHICCVFKCHCYLFPNMSRVRFYLSIKLSKTNFTLNVISKAVFTYACY